MKTKSLLIAATVSMLAVTAASPRLAPGDGPPAPGQTIVVSPGPTPPAVPAPPPAVGAPPTAVTTTTTTPVPPPPERVHIWNDSGAWWNTTKSFETEHKRLFNANEFTFDFFGYY